MFDGLTSASETCSTHAVLETRRQKVRTAGAAGTFYPARPGALISIVDGMLERAETARIEGSIMAVVAPHAGYPYSGPVAAYAYAALKGEKFARVVVIAPSHREAFGFTSVYDGGAYATPLGTVPIDTDFASRLANMSSTIRFSERGHALTPYGAEHALEVQLPWLQRVLGEFALVPVIMGDQNYLSSRILGMSLAKMLQGESRDRTLVVASSDLSHYHPYDEATKLDHRMLNALQAWDYLTMSRNFEEHIWEACGSGPIVAAMIAAERLGANRAALLRYANSGDVTGDRSRVVGYSAVALVKGSEEQVTQSASALSEGEREQLIALARASVECAVRERSAYVPEVLADAGLNQERSAFVTLRKSGKLRGCIGYVSATKPLYETVRDTATLAAFHDPRFQPVSTRELPELEYEISVLSPMRRVLDIRQIEIGRHGLLVRRGDREGLLLPQVAAQLGWDSVRFLEQTCAKAGMSRDSWKREDADVFAFTAEVFGESFAAK